MPVKMGEVWERGDRPVLKREIVMGSQALACCLQCLLKIDKNSGDPGEVVGS